jgi:hypothetical protein
MVDWYGLGWFVFSLAALVLLQRRLHFEIQAIFILLFGRAEIAMVLFSLLLFPGVFLHEISHFFMAGLLGVRIGRFSLWPRPMSDNRLQLGFVETASTDWVRDALIGISPLLAGGAFVAYTGLGPLGLLTVWDSLVGKNVQNMLATLGGWKVGSDFYLWLYLTFAVSSTMLPSSSDRKSWLPLLIIVCSLIAAAVFVGAGPWMLANFSPLLNRLFQALTMVFSISAGVHIVVLLPSWMVRKLIGRLRGQTVVS